MKFDRKTDTVMPTRDFSFGALAGVKDKPLSQAEVDALTDDAIEHMVSIAKVAKVMPKDEARAAAKAAAEGKTGTDEDAEKDTEASGIAGDVAKAKPETAKKP
jgi:hypothetical protein